MLRNQKGAAMIAVLSIAVILNIALMAIFYTVKHTTDKSGKRRSKTTALNIAEAGKEHLYGQVRWGLFKPKPDSLVTAFSEYAFQGGNFSVLCSSNALIDTIWARSTGNDPHASATISVIAALSPDLIIPYPPVRGAITSRGSVLTKGTIEVDGRDHDTSNVVVGAGIYGVSTSGLLSIQGNAVTIGGIGVTPVNSTELEPIRSSIVQENATVEPFLSSPEAFLGLPAGSLDEYKTTTLITPFSGLVYLTQSSGPIHFGESSGILIVHNEFTTAQLEMNTGRFKGLIICDELGKISGNAVIIGGVVTLTAGEVSTLGTGTAVIKYSSQVLSNLSDYCKDLKKKVTEVVWREE